MTRRMSRGFIVTMIAVVLSSAVFAQTVIKLSDEQPASYINNVYLKQWAQDVNKTLAGKVDVQLFVGGQLYNDQNALQNLTLGGVQMVSTHTGYWPTILPQVGVFNLPFVVNDLGKSYTSMYDLQSPVMKEINNLAEKQDNVKILATFKVGRVILFSRKPINSPADLKGLKVRAIGGKNVEDSLRTVGADPITIAAPELAGALQQGVVDAAMGSCIYWQGQFANVAKYALDLGGLWNTVYFVGVYKPTWDSLTPNEQKVLQDGLTKASNEEYKAWDVQETDAIAKLKAGGAKIVTLTDAQRADWKAKVKPIWAAFEKKFGTGIVKLAQDSQK